MTHLNNHHVIKQVINWQNEHANGKLPTPKGLALKGLEEQIELAFASGAIASEILDAVTAEIAKAVERGYANTGKADQAVMFEEFGDVIISQTCFGLFTNTPGIEAAEACLKRIADREWYADEEGVLRRK